MPTVLGKPVLELIRQNLLDTVGNISVAEGYNVNVVATGAKRLGTPITDGQWVTVDVLLGEEQFQDLLCNNVVEKVQEFLFVATTNQPEDSDEDKTPMDLLNATVRSDIEKAIRQDITRGNLAHDTIQMAPESILDGQGKLEGIIVRCQVKYRTDIDDPSIAR